MSVTKSESGQKWINAFVAIVSILVGYIFIQFIEQLGEWFDLEAKLNYFLAITQVTGVVIGFSTFVGIFKNQNAKAYLDEVYGELTKVVWPARDMVMKLTVGIVIALSVVSSIFVLVDVVCRKLLKLIY
jgi:preprotein translocase subunit SecE